MILFAEILMILLTGRILVYLFHGEIPVLDSLVLLFLLDFTNVI
jgi:hypothetical protein